MDQRRDIARNVATWTITILLSLAFLTVGGSKLAALPPAPALFASWELPLWFMYLTGGIEVLLALALLVPRTAGIAALGLVGLMCTAAGVHIVFDELIRLAAPLLALALSATVAWARRDSFAFLLSLGHRPQAKR